MCVSISAFQLKILVAAIIVVTVGQVVVVSIGDGRAASPTSVADPSAGEITPAQRQSAQPPTRDSDRVVRHGHRLAHRSSPSAHDPLAKVLAKARPPVAPPASAVEGEEMLRPHSVNALRVAPMAARPVGPEVEAALGTTPAQRRDPAAALAKMEILADTYDDTRMSPMWPGAPSSASSVTIELVALFGICGCVAISIYGLVAFKSRDRRRSRPEAWMASQPGLRLGSDRQPV
jgi:hypothetical protein